MTVHLHAFRGDVLAGETGCDRAACGARINCSDREQTAYRGLDPERVTCVECLKRLVYRIH